MESTCKYTWVGIQGLDHMCTKLYRKGETPLNTIVMTLQCSRYHSVVFHLWCPWILLLWILVFVLRHSLAVKLWLTGTHYCRSVCLTSQLPHLHVSSQCWVPAPCFCLDYVFFYLLTLHPAHCPPPGHPSSLPFSERVGALWVSPLP